MKFLRAFWPRPGRLYVVGIKMAEEPFVATSTPSVLSAWGNEL